LVGLYVGGNQLTSLDLSSNTALRELVVSGNQLTRLDVSSNTALEWLFVSNNQLTSLDVSSNTALELLSVWGNQLTSLDVSRNTVLEILDVRDNYITSVDAVIGWRGIGLTLVPEGGSWVDGNFVFYPQNLPTQPPTQDAPSSWAVSYVERANELGIVPANFSSNFTQNTTRAEFAALAVQIFETVTGSVIDGRSMFDDTDDVNVQKAAYIGVVGGVGGGRFDPGGTLTREQAAAMISRLADAIGNPLPAQAADFADGDAISVWARDYVGSMQATGIMGGVGGGRFDPQGAYTREQSIITAVRLFDIVISGTGDESGTGDGSASHY
jgi:hypothetical protein